MKLEEVDVFTTYILVQLYMWQKMKVNYFIKKYLLFLFHMKDYFHLIYPILCINFDIDLYFILLFRDKILLELFLK